MLSLVIFVSSVFQARAKKVQCISNLRALHSALSGYLTDHRSWPQMEKDRFNYSEEEFFEFWVTKTEPYGMSQETWLCPSDRSMHLLMEEMKLKFYGSYSVTRFDENPTTPFRWNQPWAIERGDFHGKGAHILQPDGSVHESQNPFYGR